MGRIFKTGISWDCKKHLPDVDALYIEVIKTRQGGYQMGDITFKSDANNIDVIIRNAQGLKALNTELEELEEEFQAFAFDESDPDFDHDHNKNKTA